MHVASLDQSKAVEHVRRLARLLLYWIKEALDALQRVGRSAPVCFEPKWTIVKQVPFNKHSKNATLSIGRSKL